MMSDPHRFPVRVYYEDTDAGGIVYHASYLKFAERARTEWLRTLGFNHKQLKQEHGIIFAVHTLEVTFHQPAYLDDELIMETRLARLGGARMELEQSVKRDKDRIAELRVNIACLQDSGRAGRIPDVLRQAFI